MRGETDTLLPPGSRVGPRWGSVQWQGRTAVGVDLGGGSLKVAQVTLSGKTARLETFAWVPLPVGTVAEGVVIHPGELAALLRTVFRALNIRQRRVAVCIGGPGVMMRPITLPAVPEAELREAMKYEAPQYLPIPEEQLTYDFALLPQDETTPEGQRPVFIAGTHRRLVDSYVATAEAAGLHLIALEPDCLCTLRALAATGRWVPDRPEGLAVVDCGEDGLGLTIFHAGVPVLNRTIAGGIAELREQVADGLGATVVEAQARLWGEGVAFDSPVGQVADEWLNNAAEAVGRSLEFFLIQNRDVRTVRLYLTGPWGALPHLDHALRALILEMIGNRLAQEALRVQPADLTGFPAPNRPEVEAVVGGPALVTALGAALREV